MTVQKYFPLLFISIFISCGQSKQPTQNKTDQIRYEDSLIKAAIKDMPAEEQTELLKMYTEGSPQDKEFVLFALSMRGPGKKDLIANIDSNFDKIDYLRTGYSKLVPQGYTVEIEFNPEDKLTRSKESVDLEIVYGNNTDKEWNLEYNSPVLNKMLEPLGWTNETIGIIKKLLTDANCISISNGDVTTIGFGRSGMGKYSFRLFDHDLTKDEIKKYNDSCTYIYYKKNIVLEYGGGAAGPQCFPD